MAEQAQLEEIVRRRIAEHGPITFEHFMDMALYYPSLGYYASGRIGLGREGDFYTSPHLHPVFGAVLARQLEECWNALGRPVGFSTVEQGAGRGYLALDILNYLKGSALYDSMKYIIMEINPAFQSVQEELLGDHRSVLEWVTDFGGLSDFDGCFLSNELIDAFPVHLIVFEEGLLREIHVGLRDGKLSEVPLAPSTGDIGKYLSDFSLSLGEGYRTEVNLRAREWIRSVAEKVRQGFIITVDYGYDAPDYYSEERRRGTLMCYHRHRLSENPYENIGAQDITAHVNFSALRKWGEECGFRTLGFCPQGTYLVSMGIDEIISEQYAAKEDFQFEVAKIKGLIVPSSMGESHKVMVQFKGSGEPYLRGFVLRNRARSL